MNRVAVIGHFGGDKYFCDGQTVKTKNTAELLERHGTFAVTSVDTYYFKTNKLKLLADTVCALFTCEHIFLLVSVNGMRVYLPLLYYLNKITKKNIYHYIIGSEILDLVACNKKLVQYLNAMAANWFEYESGTQCLRQMGVTNVSTLPNFKLLTPVPEATVYIPENGVYRFCTFSRVMEEKGITDAINAVRRINSSYSHKILHLDIYGPIDPAYSDTLQQLLKDCSDCISYMGVAQSSESVEILKNYYALLFPTRWAGEGFPGTIIDAFASGLPVIASDWNANKELIQDMKQGILYPSSDFRTMEDALLWAVQNPDQMARMRSESRATYDQYTPDAVWCRIHAKMQEDSFLGSVS